MKEKVLTLKQITDLYHKYGDLGIEVETQYGFKKINGADITAHNSDIYKLLLDDNKFVEGSPDHLVKTNNNFIKLKDLIGNELIQTINGYKKIKSIDKMEIKEDLYDIEVDDVKEYYSNGIVSHNSTLAIDSLKFLLHGGTSKTEKNEQIFNTYSDKNELVVRGMIEIEGVESIIERKLKRSAKKDGSWNVNSKLNYYKILPDNTEELLNDEDSIKTTKKIRETIGTEKEFEMLVLATEKNLDELIGLTTGESGKVITRLIGLEILELKEGIARTMYNEFSKKKKSNEYDVITLNTDITDHKEKIDIGIELETTLSTKLDETKTDILNLNAENDRLLNTKNKIDVTITVLNPSKLESDLATITTKGTALKDQVATLILKIKTIGNINFDEDRYHELTKNLGKYNSDTAVKNAEINRLKKQISNLTAGGICQACNRKLDDVDNTPHIQQHEKTIIILTKEVQNIIEEIKKINIEIAVLNDIKKQIDEKNRLELDKDRAEVEMGSLRNEMVGKKNDLIKYNLNLSSIEMNKKIDSEVSLVKTNISVCEHTKEDTLNKLQKVKFDLETNKTNIETKTKLIETLKKEEEVDKIYRIYIDLVGKKGVSKLVLRSVLPIINSEVQRLLEDVCDFEIEIFIDDKNEVQFHLIRDGITKLLKSGSGFEKTAASLALRSVLGKVSTLPMPNFITFDEVLGKVHPEFLEKLKPLFDKIKNMYDIVFLITHNDLVKDWGDNIITVIKENNISKLTVK